MNSHLSWLGAALANHLWQSTAFALVVWGLTWSLRMHHARVRYALWLAASAKFLVPLSLLIYAGNLLPHSQRPVAPVVYSAVNFVEAPFAAAVPPPGAPVVHSPTMWERYAAFLPMSLGILWALGAGVVLVVWWNRWRAASVGFRKTTPAVDGRELEILHRLEARLRSERGRRPLPRRSLTRRSLPLRLSPERMEPAIFGLFRPTLVWPRQLSERLDDEQIEAILAHELMHVRRRDNLTAAFHMLVEAIFWFHPLVWWMDRQMVKEREQACDEAVVEMGGDAGTYAESLLQTCRFCVESRLPCVAGVTGAELKKRIAGILSAHVLMRMTWPKKLLLIAVGIISLTVPIAVGVVWAQTGGSHPIAIVPMSADAHPSFAVAAIKLHDPNSDHQGFNATGDRFIIRNENVTSLMMFAYSIDKHQIANMPDWVDNASYDIEGTTDTAGQPSLHQQQEMIQKLLADRFQLKFHRERRELPVYAIQIEKGGPRLTPATDPNAQPDQGGNSHGTEITQVYTSSSIADFILGMQFFLDRPIVDQTGLTGRYDFKLRYTYDESSTTDPNAPPGLSTAIREQLGLKLQATKASANVFVIDRVERPSEN